MNDRNHPIITRITSGRAYRQLAWAFGYNRPRSREVEPLTLLFSALNDQGRSEKQWKRTLHGSEAQATSHPLFDSEFYWSSGDLQWLLIDPLLHFVRHGGPAGRSPHLLFDTTYYLSTYPDVRQSGQNPLIHYLAHGAANYRNPHPLFDTAYYVRTNKDVSFERTNPLVHYVTCGEAEMRNPHPLFDVRFYRKRYPDIPADTSPLIHFILYGAAELRCPHSLFDTAYYMSRYPDVKAAGVNPLEHFVRFGTAEGRQPHPLFDTAFYLRTNPDVAKAQINALAHFVEHGGRELRDPHPLFYARYYLTQCTDGGPGSLNPLIDFLEQTPPGMYDPNPFFSSEFYTWMYPDVAAAGVNPLMHYVEAGASEGRDPHPLFGTNYYLSRHPNVARTGENPLSHYLSYGRSENRSINRPLSFSDRCQAGSGRQNTPRGNLMHSAALDCPVQVFCVYGPANVEFISKIGIPAYLSEAQRFPVELHLVNYRDQTPLFESHPLTRENAKGLFSLTDWSGKRAPGHLGFGEAINYLFEAVNPRECFIIANPDSYPMPGCFSRLIETYVSAAPAIVEARQWPREHPKEYNAQTGETPWASGAFSLFSSNAFQQLGGFDPVYFLYLEDVDLSWRAWLGGFRVLYEPRAFANHSTGLFSYQPNRFYYENFFSLRNFLIISYKFFGELGERIAIARINTSGLPKTFVRVILDSYHLIKPRLTVLPGEGQRPDKVKILGLNIFHEMRM